MLRNMMRFPTEPMRSERNDKIYSEDAYNVFASITRAELYPKQAFSRHCRGGKKF